MIIDFRLRPPHALFQKPHMTQWDRVRDYADRFGLEPAPSALQGSMATLEAEMRDAGISAGVMNARYTPGYPGIVTNEDVAQIAREHPGVFLGLGSVDPNWTADVIQQETQRCVQELGLVGMSIDPYLLHPPRYATDEVLQPLYQACREHDVPVVITLSGSSPPDFSYCSPGAIDAVAARYPQLRIVVAHACWPRVHEMCAVVFRRRNVWISPDMYMFAPGATDYVQAANTFARERFLFGSCYPNMPLKAMVDRHRQLPFRDDVLEKVFRANAAALLRLV